MKYKKIYLEIGDYIVLENWRYPAKVQKTGIWLINEVEKTKNALELKLVLYKECAKIL